MKAAFAPLDTTRRGDVQAAYFLGKCAEYLKCGDLLDRLEELMGDAVIIPSLERAVADVDTWQTKHFRSVFDFRLYRIALYAILRELAPATFVETGVLHGMTSAFLLRGLQLNGRGRLISIDLPSYHATGPANQDGYYATLPPGKEVGWMIPQDLRSAWELHLGPSVEVLPKIAPRVGGIDIFCHDSEHTYATMWFELNFAWERLNDGGLIVCDNIDACSAFHDFCQKVNRRPLYLPAPDMEFNATPRFALMSKGAI